jgi:hypothetical protein
VCGDEGERQVVGRTTVMRTIVAVAATVASCAATVPRPIQNSKCPDSEARGELQTESGWTSGLEWAVPLQLCAFGKGFRLCNPSREPSGMTGFWQVSPAEVAKIDRALFSFLREQDQSEDPQQELSGDAVSDLERHGRQYLGFFRSGHRYVFVNAFPQNPRITPQLAETQVIGVCDAGWGVEYDLSTQQFTKFAIAGLVAR